MTAPNTKPEIETLTPDEAGALRVLIRCPGWGSQREVQALAKMLRVVDQLTEDRERSLDFAAETGVEIGALRAELAAVKARLEEVSRG